MNMFLLQANFQVINAQSIAPKISPKINFPVCIVFKSIDQLTGNSSMPSFEMGGSPLQATDDQKRPSLLDQVISEKQPDRGLL